jgi:hypothetical protein
MNNIIQRNSASDSTKSSAYFPPYYSVLCPHRYRFYHLDVVVRLIIIALHLVPEEVVRLPILKYMQATRRQTFHFLD